QGILVKRGQDHEAGHNRGAPRSVAYGKAHCQGVRHWQVGNARSADLVPIAIAPKWRNETLNKRVVQHPKIYVSSLIKLKRASGDRDRGGSRGRLQLYC